MRRMQNTSHITQSGGAHTFTGFSLKIVPKNVPNIVQKFVSKILCTKLVKKSVPKLLKEKQ